MGAFFPHTVDELDRLFPDEDRCRAYLVQLRWPQGFVCPRCQGKVGWAASRGRFVCGDCRHQATVTAGTVFQDTRLPLRLWFHAIWQVVSQKNGAARVNCSTYCCNKPLGKNQPRTAPSFDPGQTTIGSGRWS